MNKNRKDKEQKQKIKELDSIIESYMNSGKSISEFIKEHIFEEYQKTGNKKLAEEAAEYFADLLE